MDKSLKLVMEKLEIWYELMMKALPNFIVAIVIIFVFVFIAKFACRISRKIMKKNVSNQALEGLIETVIYVGIILVGLFTALEVLHLDKTVTSLLAGAGGRPGSSFHDTISSPQNTRAVRHMTTPPGIDDKSGGKKKTRKHRKK